MMVGGVLCACGRTGTPPTLFLLFCLLVCFAMRVRGYVRGYVVSLM